MTDPRVFRALVVDDEPTARDVVCSFLEDVPNVVVVGQAAHGRAAVAEARDLQPDLLFLDVQMPDMDGFAVLQELGDEAPPGVVLVTAHDQYARRAFEIHAIDYVTKPFGRPRFMAAVERAVRRLEADDALDSRETIRSLLLRLRTEGTGAMLLSAEPSSVGGPARIGVRAGARTTIILVQDIDWLEADEDLVRLHASGKAHLVSGRMKDFESRLESGRFHRIHRSVIVNLDRVRALERDRDGGGVVVLHQGVRLRVSRRRWDQLEAALGLDFTG